VKVKTGQVGMENSTARLSEQIHAKWELAREID
jgi:hypothetical protein